MYQKEIIYLGLYKDGERLGNAGFLKVEKWDKDGNMSLVVKNVPHSINGKYPVRVYNGSDWKETDGITVREGGGQWEMQEPYTMRQIRLQIMLPGGYLVEGVSREAGREATEEVTKRTEEKAGETTAEESERDLRELSASLQEQPVVAEEPVYSMEEPAESAVPLQEQPAADFTAESAAPKKIERIVVQRQESRGSEVVSEQSYKPLMADTLTIEGLKEDKWEQILSTYDNIHPYGDERVYVKLAPKDFIILSEKYQHLVNNSFLLHGFYNYRHVILGKEGEKYYLGVPGVFYEREKMVALMFGFEAFECGSGEPKAGEFGYYLRQVEL